jgi:hypothetical protein
VHGVRVDLIGGEMPTKRLEQMAQESESGLPISPVGQITKNLSSPVCKNIPLNMSPKSAA